MGLLSRVWNAVGSLFGGRPSVPATEQKSWQARDPRPYLAGAAPGLWASNHLNEALRCEGWQFVVVRSLARMCSQAILGVFEVGSHESRVRRTRRALRFARMIGDKTGMRRWKSRLKKLRRERKNKAPAQPAAVARRHACGEDDPLVRLLRRPNPEWSLPTFVFAAVQQLALTGSALVWCVRHLGQPAELYVLPTGLCTPRPPSAQYPQGSHYLTPLSTYGLAVSDDAWSAGTLGSALLTGVEIDNRDIKAIRWPHPVYLSDGQSPLTAVRLWVDVANQMDLATWHAMENAPRPGLIISQPDASIQPDPADKARFEEWLRSDSAGVSNTGKHAWLPPGLAAEPRSATPADVDFPAGRQAYRDMNLAAHAVSPIACGITEAGNYSALWAAIKQTNELAVRPTLGLLAGELTELLGADLDGPRRQIELTPQAIDDPQLLDQKSKRWIAAGNGVKVNEWRALEGLPLLDGPEGEQFIGVKVNVAAKDTDPDKPGFQDDGRDEDERERDDAGDEADTGTRREDRDRPPGRPDGNGKHLTNGHVHTRRF